MTIPSTTNRAMPEGITPGNSATKSRPENQPIWSDVFLSLLGYLVFLVPLFYFFIWSLLPLDGMAKVTVAGVIGVMVIAITLFLVIKHGPFLKQVNNFLVLLFIVLGAPIISIYLIREDLILVFKIFIIGYFSFLPAWIYLLFISTKGQTLYDEYVLNLYRLHIDHYPYLPEPPKYTGFHLYWSELKNTLPHAFQASVHSNIYKKKFEALYGPVPDREDGARDVGFFLFRAENVWPVIIATTIIAVGWILVVEPDTVFGINLVPNATPIATTGPQVPLETIRFAILGIYFYILQMLVRRYFQNDLKTSAYLNATMRYVVVIPLVWVVHLLLQAQLQPEYLQALAFVIGVFPSIGWEAIVALIRTPIKVVVPSLKKQYPLSDLDGLNIWYESRLLEEGIEDMQNLATSDLVDVILNTRIPVKRLVDWIDQSLLYLHMAEVKSKPEQNGATIRDRLRNLGIRTATDLDILFAAEADSPDAEKLVDKLQIMLGDQILLHSIHKTFQNDPNFYHINEWKRNTTGDLSRLELSELKKDVVKLDEELKSISSSSATDLKFVNESTETINIFWRDYEGQDVQYNSLPPGESYTQSTFATHPWVVKLADTGKVLTTVIAEKDNRPIVITQEMV